MEVLDPGERGTADGVIHSHRAKAGDRAIMADPRPEADDAQTIFIVVWPFTGIRLLGKGHGAEFMGGRHKRPAMTN